MAFRFEIPRFVQPFYLYAHSLARLVIIVLSSLIFYVIDDPLQDLGRLRNDESRSKHNLNLKKRARNLSLRCKQLDYQVACAAEPNTKQKSAFQREDSGFGSNLSKSFESVKSKSYINLNEGKNTIPWQNEFDPITSNNSTFTLSSEVSSFNSADELEAFKPIVSGEITEALRCNTFKNVNKKRIRCISTSQSRETKEDSGCDPKISWRFFGLIPQIEDPQNERKQKQQRRSASLLRSHSAKKYYGTNTKYYGNRYHFTCDSTRDFNPRDS